MARGHVVTVGGMLAIAGRALMRSHAFAFKIGLNRSCCDPDPKLLFQQLMRNRVIMPSHIYVVIKANTAFFPFSINLGPHRQGLQGGPVLRLKQIPAAGPQMPGHFPVQLVHQGPDRCVQFIETEEALVA